ncbi:MAG: dihydrodipicolinate synthase family protein [Acidobacteriota bacterium]|nr:dihydrodipicolinate synthase family protein [Acidobacteriota bacterium]
MNWTGVLPALTTAFDKNLKVDVDFVMRHARWQVENGVSGLVALGSLGEGATLEHDEKLNIIEALVDAVQGKVPVVATISALSTADAVNLAKSAQERGASGLMILPPYVYKGDWREMKAHVAAVLAATGLPAMLYNNPIAYGTDFLPHHIEELAREFETLRAVKESSADVRRVSAIRAILGDRIAICVGVDDAIVEGIAAGACGWVAGLVNAMPRESVDLFNLARDGKSGEAFELYRWFLPLLRMDTVPKFIQLIKQVQEELGVGNARVRGPRLQVVGEELAETRAAVEHALATRPAVARPSTAFPS